MKIFKRILISLVVIMLIAGAAGYFVYTDYRAFLETPLDIPDTGLPLEVPPATSLRDIARRLQRDGALDSGLYLQIYARLEGSARRIKAGEYRITPDTTPPQLMQQLVSGKVRQYPLTIVEGWTFRQMMEAVRNHPEIQQTLKGLSDADIMARLGHPDENPEGRFFPDTYHFPRGTTDVVFLKRAYDTMARHLDEAWGQRAPDLPLKTPYQALILASIIEKETGLPEERPAIAGVFIRRLRKGMRLQTDPTVIYGLGENFDGNLRRRDLRQDMPYNTYVHGGLPPTPIALPGEGSLAAAVNPAPGDALYFVATGDGGHVFSNTLQEHNRAVRKYQLRRR